MYLLGLGFQLLNRAYNVKVSDYSFNQYSIQ